MSENITKEEFGFKMKTYQLIADNDVLILTRAHLNFWGKEKSTRDLKADDFNRCLIKREDIHKARLLLYIHNDECKVIKNCLSTGNLLDIMKYLEINNFTN